MDLYETIDENVSKRKTFKMLMLLPCVGRKKNKNDTLVNFII